MREEPFCGEQQEAWRLYAAEKGRISAGQQVYMLIF